MESRRLSRAKVAWAAALAIVGGLLLIAAPSNAAPASQCSVGCQFDASCGCYINCQSTCPPGGNATDVPQPTPPNSGGTPQPVATQRPIPTVIPPTGAPGGGYYTTICADAATYGCACAEGNYSDITLYVAPNGTTHVVTCNGCRGFCNATPTPRPTQPGPTPTPPYPCGVEPQPGGGTIVQPCVNQWPGYNLSVSVRIPPVNLARNPWPRSLVGLETQFCFVSAPDSLEQFSTQKAVPCNVDRGEHTDGNFNCGAPTGEVGEGGRTNYQLGVAWRRYTGSDPGFGTVPPFRSALSLDDREWNGGSRLIMLDPGQCTAHTYETTSWGLPETGEAWNPACQNRLCEYTERTLPVNRSCEACDACTCEGCYPAYNAAVQTWWWPEWTWRYDEYKCVRSEPDDCFYDPNPGGRRCSHGAHAGEAGWKETVSCVAWRWENVIEPWRQYDLRRQGLPLPYVGSGRTSAAGMTPERQVMTPFQYSPSVPVIEVQPVHP